MASYDLKPLSLVTSSLPRHTGQQTSPSAARQEQSSALPNKHIDFDPLPSPSNYRIDSSKTNRQILPFHHTHRASDSRLLDRSPSTGSSSSFNLLDSDVRRWSNGSTSDISYSRNRYSGSLVHQHRCDMSPHSASGTDDHQYRRDDLWEETNAQSNNEIKTALNEALGDLKEIKSFYQEDCFELQRQCAVWEAKFAQVANQIIDFYNENWLEEDTIDKALHVCASCLDLEVPYRGIWDVCDRIRECLTPEQQYHDDYIADPESSDVEAPSNQGKPRHTTTATGRIDDARYYSQGHQGPLGQVPNASRQLATHPSDDLIFDWES